MKLIIGNKNYSSWSLRPWLMLKHVGVPFEEELIPFEQPDTAARIAAISPSGRVPVLIDPLPQGPLKVWDSLAIAEYLHEKFPAAHLWPQDPAARAVARSVSAEMHSGFGSLRNDLTMKIRSSHAWRQPRPQTQADIDRILGLWADCRARFGGTGPFLFGAFSAADAMYAPVASRFRTYSVPIPAVAQAWCEAVWSLPSMREWEAAARLETYLAPEHEASTPP